MYGADWCGYFARARALLESKGVAFEEIDTDVVAGARQEAQARSGRRASCAAASSSEAAIIPRRNSGYGCCQGGTS